VTNFIQEFSNNECLEQLKGDLRTMDGFLSKRDLEEGLPYESISKGPTLKRPMKRKSFYAKGQWSSLKGLESPDIRECIERLRTEPITFTNTLSILDSLPYARPSQIFNHSKLHFLSDRGGKTRVIAMGDVLTQTLVRPIHREIFRALRKMPTDGTMDQLRQRERVRIATLGKGVINSIDMKSCTDRLPAVFQLLVLYFSGLLTIEQSVAWYLLMVKRAFVYYSRRGLKRAVTYTIGQPMGILSSWAVMALSHHVLVR